MVAAFEVVEIIRKQGGEKQKGQQGPVSLLISRQQGGFKGHGACAQRDEDIVVQNIMNRPA